MSSRLHSNLGDVYFDGLMQERRNSVANALELRLFALTHRINKYVYTSYI